MLQQHPIFSLAFFFKTLFLLIVFLILSAGMQAEPKVQQAMDDCVRKAVVKQLVADGLVASDNHPVYFFVLGDEIETNGHTLRGELYEKYLALLQSFHLKETERWGFYDNSNQLVFQGILDQFDQHHFVQHYQSVVQKHKQDASLRGADVSS